VVGLTLEFRYSFVPKTLDFVPQPSLRGLFRALFKGEGGVDHARFG
jgi:hypothetical protein